MAESSAAPMQCSLVARNSRNPAQDAALSNRQAATRLQPCMRGSPQTLAHHPRGTAPSPGTGSRHWNWKRVSRALGSIDSHMEHPQAPVKRLGQGTGLACGDNGPWTHLTVTWERPSSADSCTATERTEEWRRQRVQAHLRTRCISSRPRSMLRARQGLPARPAQPQHYGFRVQTSGL